jgi:pyruvate,water dikinase
MNYPFSQPGADKLRQKYQGLQSLLGENSHLLEIMADLEADLRFLPLGSESLEHQIRSLLEGTLLMIEDLNRLGDGRFGALYKAYLEVEKEITETLKASKNLSSPRWVIPISEIELSQEAEVGGKAARLGELKKAFPGIVPDGFVATASAYQTWMSQPALASEVRPLLDALEASGDRERFSSKAAHLKEVLLKAPLPPPVQEAIRSFAKAHWSSSQRWAVRSSAIGEDSSMTFAGQFESVLNVPSSQLEEAYQKVLASRFSERAVSYRLLGGFTEVETPMAVLFMPLIEARSSGVLYTRDPDGAGGEEILVGSTWGLAAELVVGLTLADLFRVDRKDTSRVLKSRTVLKEERLIPGAPFQLKRQENPPEDQNAPSLNPEEIARLASSALAIEAYFGGPQDIEWAIDQPGRLWILQSRPLRMVEAKNYAQTAKDQERPLLSGGLTIFPGRAVAPVQVVSTPPALSPKFEGVVLVLPQATPEIASVLPYLAGFIAERGHPLSHAATLLREFAIPSLFEVQGATKKLHSGTLIGLDAAHGQVFLGAPWPEIRQRTLARLTKPRVRRPLSPLNDLILNLRMVDPMARSFKPQNCKSIHDLIRFAHEKGVATLFQIGDLEAQRRGVLTRRLASPVPLHLFLLDLGNALAPGAVSKREVSPEEILSIPFQALWRGISHPQMSWAGRREISVKGLASVMASSLSQDMGAMRKLGDPNYLLVGPEYMNLNIRLAYHYAMVDALVGPVTENNYVNFRFRGGGGGPSRRDLRARFLTEVLLRSGFHTDRRGDLVTAWLRSTPQESSEGGLELLGRLIPCARQLDMLMDNEPIMLHFVERFLTADYQAFA